MSEATLKKLGAGMGEDPEGVCSPISKEFRIVLILGMQSHLGLIKMLILTQQVWDRFRGSACSQSFLWCWCYWLMGHAELLWFNTMHAFNNMVLNKQEYKEIGQYPEKVNFKWIFS